MGSKGGVGRRMKPENRQGNTFLLESVVGGLALGARLWGLRYPTPAALMSEVFGVEAAMILSL